MLPSETIVSLARRLFDARRSRVPLRHFSREQPGMNLEDGYAIQREWVRLEQAAGHEIRGRKIGLTSRAMQQASQITEPDYAPLMDDMFFETGTDVPFGEFIAPRVEVELAFVLGRPLEGPGVSLFDVLRATERTVRRYALPPGLAAASGGASRMYSAVAHGSPAAATYSFLLPLAEPRSAGPLHVEPDEDRSKCSFTGPPA